MFHRLPLRSMFALLAAGAALQLAGCECGMTDADADGWTTEEGDCDDENPLLHPAAQEIACDGVDQDCNLSDLRPDEDNDGSEACPASPDDCDDNDATVFPGAEEQCDEVDHDCDGDEYNGLAPTLWYPDEDGDGFGDSDGETVENCEESFEGYAAADGDCDDGDDAINPDADEVCDEVDHDCDGNPLNGFELDLWWPDADGDSYGDRTEIPVISCEESIEGWVNNNGDCDDTPTVGVLVNPDGVETCDARDENCDGQVDEGFDADGDGVTTCGADGDFATTFDNDCVDVAGDAVSASIFPGQLEVCDGIDNDCDCPGDTNGDTTVCGVGSGGTDAGVDEEDPGFAGADADGDGDPSVLCPGAGGGDCDDTDPVLNSLDVDLDGVSSCDGDCDDESPISLPGAFEYCDGVDNDCDGLTDANDPDTSADGDADGFDGVACGGDDCDDSDPHVYPEELYTSGVQKECLPAVYPGFQQDWFRGRVEQPFHFVDPVTGGCFLYFRGEGDQTLQSFGVVDDPTCSGNWSHPNDNPANPILEPGVAGWDALTFTPSAGPGMSNPAVYHLPGTARPYGLLYHAKYAGGNRDVGLATAIDPLGPFERKDHDGVALGAPVLIREAATDALDSRQVHHPTVYFDGALIHVWYTGRTLGAGGAFNNLYATSPDGVNWTKFDDPGTGAFPDVVVGPGLPGSWSETRVVQPGILLNDFDPDGAYTFEHWWAGRDGSGVFSLGVGHGSAANVIECDANPVLELGPPSRADGFLVGGQGVFFEPDTGSAAPGAGEYHIHYGGVVSIDTEAPFDPPADEWYQNITSGAAYVLDAHNPAPEVVVTDLADNDTVSAPFDVNGEITDNGPDTVIVGIEFVTPGGAAGSGTTVLGTVAAPPLPTDLGVQTSTFGIAGLNPGAGTYDALVTVEDEGCARRTLRISNVTVQ